LARGVIWELDFYSSPGEPRSLYLRRLSSAGSQFKASMGKLARETYLQNNQSRWTAGVAQVQTPEFELVTDKKKFPR
jgi:hypothetical protein